MPLRVNAQAAGSAAAYRLPNDFNSTFIFMYPIVSALLSHGGCSSPTTDFSSIWAAHMHYMS